MKKLSVLIILLLISFACYVIVIVLPRDYEVDYQVGAFKVNESFNKDLGHYQFLVEYEERIYPLLISQSYSSARKLVKGIHGVSLEDTICLVVYIDIINIGNKYPICYKGENLISFHLVKNTLIEEYPELFEKEETLKDEYYESIKIHTNITETILVWNYKGYYYLNANNKQNIKFLNTDSYTNALGYKYNNFLITPNYDKKHFFNEYYVIDVRRAELSSFEFDANISYNSYYQGDYRRDIYLVDRRNKLQYKIDIRKELIEVVGNESDGGKWYNNGWEDITINKLIQNDYLFVKDKTFNYIVEKDRLYQVIGEHKILVTNNKIKDVVQINNEMIYYLSGNILYRYSPWFGETKLIENSEWDFNYQNKIFVFET